MKNVYFQSLSSLFFAGKVRKEYNVGDTIKLKRMSCKLKIIRIESDYGRTDYIAEMA